jgi:hypothetical protein
VTSLDPSPLIVLSYPVFLVSLEEEDSIIVPGFVEPTISNHSLDKMISSLVPSINGNFGSLPIPTYLGKDLVTSSSSKGGSSVTSGVGTDPGKDPTWSRGLGLELSPIKTRSARKKAGSVGSSSAIQSVVLDQGALRGMKSLAQAKS